MLSQAGRQYERSKRVKPLERMQREKIYKSMSVKVDRVSPNSKFSPFNTISRESRNSYLLRVTHEPNTNTNYTPKVDLTLPLDRRSTIDRAKFQRIIGEVKPEAQTIDLASLDSKCIKSFTANQHRPLTVRQTHNWRKTFEHFDFKKQPETNRLKFPKQLSVEESTQADFMSKLQTITESNFNNFKRFSFKAKTWKAHDFDSDSPHQYLRDVQIRDKSPEYHIQDSDQSYVHKSMPKTKGEKRFFLYKNKIATRIDRSDKDWFTYLGYNDQKLSLHKPTVDFDKTIDRRPNEVHSSYPIRGSLQHITKLREKQ